METFIVVPVVYNADPPALVSDILVIAAGGGTGV